MSTIKSESAKHVFEPIAWLMQLFSGLILTLLITVHFYTIHFIPHAIDYIAVIERVSSTSYKIMYASLILLVSFHAFNGLRAILLDTGFGANKRAAINVLTLSVFISISIHGIILLLII